MQAKQSASIENYRDKIHVVLVSPQNSLNIGSVLRAMLNLGFRNLHLVTPEHYDERKIAATACNAAHLIPTIKIHASLPEALAPMQQVIGFSARDGRNRGRSYWLHEWCSEVATNTLEAQTALMFGPEDNGLSQEHLSHCRAVITIPSPSEYTSYNLSQAVLLSLFQIFHAFELTQYPSNTNCTSDAQLVEHSRDLAEWQEFYYLDEIVDSVLQASHFFRKGTPSPVPLIVKRLLRRTAPDKREMGILLGMFRRIEGVLVGRVPSKSIEDN